MCKVEYGPSYLRRLILCLSNSVESTKASTSAWSVQLLKDKVICKAPQELRSTQLRTSQEIPGQYSTWYHLYSTILFFHFPTVGAGGSCALAVAVAAPLERGKPEPSRSTLLGWKKKVF